MSRLCVVTTVFWHRAFWSFSGPSIPTHVLSTIFCSPDRIWRQKSFQKCLFSKLIFHSELWPYLAVTTAFICNKELAKTVQERLKTTLKLTETRILSYKKGLKKLNFEFPCFRVCVDCSSILLFCIKPELRGRRSSSEEPKHVTNCFTSQQMNETGLTNALNSHFWTLQGYQPLTYLVFANSPESGSPKRLRTL